MPDLGAPTLRHRTAPELRHRVLVALGVVERKFDPHQLRDPHTGEWVDMPGSGSPSLLDKLKLAGRIDLDDGEELVSSGKLDGDNGAIRVAVTRSADGRLSLRLGADSSDEGLPKWTGNKPRTAEIQAERRRIDAERDLLDEDDPRYEQLTAQLDDLGEEDWSTARLDETSYDQLRTQLGEAFAAATTVERSENKRWDEIARLEAERAKLRGMGRKWTAEEEARWDSLTEQIEALQAGAADTSVSEFDKRGVIPGDWGDVHYHVYFEEIDTGTKLLVGVRPHGVDDDWELRDWKGVFEAAEIREILKLLGRKGR